MRHGLMVCLVALCLAGAVSGCDWGGGTDTEGSSPAPPTASRPPTPTVESSLEGLTALPARIRWTASTSLPPVQVKNVFFLVDCDRWWGDSTPPYTFGPPGAYLPVRWVSSLPSRSTGHSGRTHEFAILVVTTAGDKWKSEPVRARTPPRAHVRPPGFGRFGRDESRAIDHPALAFTARARIVRGDSTRNTAAILHRRPRRASPSRRDWPRPRDSSRG